MIPKEIQLVWWDISMFNRVRMHRSADPRLKKSLKKIMEETT